MGGVGGAESLKVTYEVHLYARETLKNYRQSHRQDNERTDA